MVESLIYKVKGYIFGNRIFKDLGKFIGGALLVTIIPGSIMIPLLILVGLGFRKLVLKINKGKST